MHPASRRDQLLRAASQAFTTVGIAATGVDTVVRVSGVSKPTLYAYFGSKSELVRAVLAQRWQACREELEAWLASEGSGRGPLAVLDWLAVWYARESRRGCGFLNAAAELTAEEDEAARMVVRDEKRWLRAVIARLAEEDGIEHPERVASQVLLLVDGVAGRVLVEGAAAAPAALDDARAAARALLAVHRPDAGGADGSSHGVAG